MLIPIRPEGGTGGKTMVKRRQLTTVLDGTIFRDDGHLIVHGEQRTPASGDMNGQPLHLVRAAEPGPGIGVSWAGR
ncbi:hypothetical protein [Streptomyces sp. NPDC127066]|uniref:hypothetical protein n=1 Tax=Streptomyces sp. NPDC127066 TaxID=3347125 RepID=UPI00366A383A